MPINGTSPGMNVDVNQNGTLTEWNKSYSLWEAVIMSEVHGAHIFHLLQVQLVKCFLILMNHVAVHKLMMKVITGGKE